MNESVARLVTGIHALRPCKSKSWMPEPEFA